MRKHAANMVTGLSISLSVYAIVLASAGDEKLSFACIFIAFFLDGLDGIVARLFGIGGSEMGKELDSLADMVAFGIAPAILVFHDSFLSPSGGLGPGAIPALIFILSTAYRLARFNVVGKTWFFEGLPSTVGGIALASWANYATDNPASHVTAALVISALLVSHIRYPNISRYNLFRTRPTILFYVLAVAWGVTMIKPDRLIYLPFLVYIIYGLIRSAATHIRSARRSLEPEKDTAFIDKE